MCEIQFLSFSHFSVNEPVLNFTAPISTTSTTTAQPAWEYMRSVSFEVYLPELSATESEYMITAVWWHLMTMGCCRFPSTYCILGCIGRYLNSWIQCSMQWDIQYNNHCNIQCNIQCILQCIIQCDRRCNCLRNNQCYIRTYSTQYTVLGWYIHNPYQHSKFITNNVNMSLFFAEIILGVVIGVALCTLIVIMVFLYSCGRYRHRRKLLRALSFTGRPHALDDDDW